MPAIDRSQQEHVVRRDAAQATLDRFRDKPFRYGRNDCSRLVAHHLRLLGYGVRLPASGSYNSLKGAKVELKKRGYADLPEALDALGLQRIPPAAALMGDIVQMPSGNGLAALAVAIGNGRIVGYHEESPGACVVQPSEFVTAWRVEVKA